MIVIMELYGSIWIWVDDDSHYSHLRGSQVMDPTVKPWLFQYRVMVIHDLDDARGTPMTLETPISV